jgi:hypothetical protein
MSGEELLWSAAVENAFTRIINDKGKSKKDAVDFFMNDAGMFVWIAHHLHLDIALWRNKVQQFTEPVIKRRMR